MSEGEGHRAPAAEVGAGHRAPAWDWKRRAWIDIDLDAVKRNTALLVDYVAPAEVCTVVKADAYGHGAVEVSKAVIAGGATRLAVSYIDEALQLREAGIQASILMMSEATVGSLAPIVENNITPTVYTRARVDELAAALEQRGVLNYPVHIKVDTGMNRLGVRWQHAVELMKEVQNHDELFLEGVYTHFAVSDEVDNPFTAIQAERFTGVLKEAADAGIMPPLVHAANSAAAIMHPDLRFSFVRFGVATYGLIDAQNVPLPRGVEPVLSVRAKVAAVKPIPAGEAVSYGQRYRVDGPAHIATLLLGYADGVPRSLYAGGGEVLIGGKRRPVAGTVSMGLTAVDCGEDDVEPGDEAVLIGQQGTQCITTADWARWTDSIEREVTCRVGATLPRNYHFGQ